MTDYTYGASFYGTQTYGPAVAPPPTINAPTYSVEISFLSGTSGTFQLDISQLDVGTLGAPFASSDFQAIDGVRSITITRGRQDALQTVQAGTVDIVIDNRDGSLSPGNPSSPYAPNVLPMRRVRVLATWMGTIYPLFYGFIESYTPAVRSPVDCDMVIHAIDVFSMLNLAPLNAAIPASDDGTWVASVLANLNTASLPQSIDTGQVNFIAYTSQPNENALQVLLDAATSAGGLFYQAKDGTLVWESRYHRTLAARSTASQGSFGQMAGAPVPGTYPFLDNYDYTMDTQQLYTAVSVHASGTAEPAQRADDSPAQDLYFVRLLSVDARFLDTGQAMSFAQALLNGYKTPVPRLRAITIDGDADTDGTLWQQVLEREISDRIHVQLDAPGKIGLDSDMFIESIQHTIIADPALGNEGHTVTWQLSYTSTIGHPFILDTSTLDSGQLG